MAKFSDLIGNTLYKVHNDDNYELHFFTTDGKGYKMYHSQDCCESVRIEDIVGDFADIEGSPILKAEVKTNKDNGEDGSSTYTYYDIATIKGSVHIRWYGTSNGYYSEEVSFVEDDRLALSKVITKEVNEVLDDGD